VLRNHGSKPKYYHKLVGGNFRLDALQAAILDVKLKHLEAWHEARRRNAARYDEAFKGAAVGVPRAVYAGRGAKNHHIYNQYVVRVRNRDGMIEKLRAADVGCEVYYPVPLHLQECFGNLGYKPGEMPESEKAANETLALPIYPELTAEMQSYVADVLTGKK
jgi:dTDP-4-amino-4,6-dideoxygalactose transaminase